MPGRFLVAVSVFVVHDGAVLLLRRSANSVRDAGTWEPVSGRVEAGETPVEAAARQVREDAGLQVTSLEPFHTFTLGRGLARDKEELIGICFAGGAQSRDVKLSPAHSRARWAPIGKLGEARLAPGVRQSVTAFYARWGRGGADFNPPAG